VKLTPEHDQLRRTVKRFIDEQINPHVDEWEAAEIFPAHEAGRLMREVTDGCLQFWGGMGYADESTISREFRDARLMSIGAGADEVMLQILSKMMGTFPKSA